MSLESEITDTIAEGINRGYATWKIKDAILALPEMVALRKRAVNWEAELKKPDAILKLPELRRSGWLHREDEEFKVLAEKAKKWDEHIDREITAIIKERVDYWYKKAGLLEGGK